MSCESVSVGLEVNPNDLRRINFDLDKICNDDNTAEWKLHFELRERDDAAKDFRSVVKLNVDINKENHSLAAATAKHGLESALASTDPKTSHAHGGADPAPAAGRSEPISSTVAAGRTSVKVAQAPGGNSSIFLGEEKQGGQVSGRKLFSGKNESSLVLGDDGASRHTTSVRVAQAPGGNSSVSFGDDTPTAGHKRAPSNDGGRPTSVKVAQAPGGTTQIVLGSESADKKSIGTGAGEVLYNVRSEISTAIYRKGKLKDTFTKFTGNRTKTLASEDLRIGIASLGIQISSAQAASFVSEYSKDPAGITYSDFVRMLTV